MKIKLIQKNILLFFILFAVLSSPVFAQRVIDNANILNTDQIDRLSNIADSFAERYNFDLVILTERDIDGADVRDYAGDFFKNKGYGIGVNKDGCIFLVVTGNMIPGSRDYCFFASGRGKRILVPNAFDKLEKDVLKYLRFNQFDNAFETFLSTWEIFLDLDAKGGRTYNFFHQWNLVLVIAVWLIALAIGFIVVQVWKKGMNTAITQSTADSYVIPGSLNYKEKQDRFLYSTVTKTKRQKQSSSSFSGGSSGRGFSGRGGKF